MRYLKACATAVLALLFLAPGALAQEAPQEGESPVEDLPVLGNLEGGARPDLPAQPDLPGQTADGAGDTAPAPASTSDTGDGGAILPVNGANADVLAASGAGLLVVGSALLLFARRLTGGAWEIGGFLRDALWAAD